MKNEQQQFVICPECKNKFKNELVLKRHTKYSKECYDSDYEYMNWQENEAWEERQNEAQGISSNQ